MRLRHISRCRDNSSTSPPHGHARAALSAVIQSRRLTANPVVSASLPANPVVRGDVLGVLGGRTGQGGSRGAVRRAVVRRCGARASTASAAGLCDGRVRRVTPARVSPVARCASLPGWYRIAEFFEVATKRSAGGGGTSWRFCSACRQMLRKGTRPRPACVQREAQKDRRASAQPGRIVSRVTLRARNAGRPRPPNASLKSSDSTPHRDRRSPSWPLPGGGAPHPGDPEHSGDPTGPRNGGGGRHGGSGRCCHARQVGQALPPSSGLRRRSSPRRDM